MRRFFLAALVILPALSLSGCIPPSTAWKLRNFKLATADVAKIRVAVRMPDWLTPTPERAFIGYYRSPPESTEPPTLKIHLQRAHAAADVAALAKLAPGDAAFVIVEAATRDLPAISALQDAAKKRLSEGVKPGSDGDRLELKDNIACRKIDIPGGPILIDLWVHPDDEIGWLPIYQQFDIGPGLEKTQKEHPEIMEAAYPPCDKRTPKVEAATAK